jgi:hypothetical protein
VDWLSVCPRRQQSARTFSAKSKTCNLISVFCSEKRAASIAERALSDKALKGSMRVHLPRTEWTAPAESIQVRLTRSLTGSAIFNTDFKVLTGSEQDVTGKLARCRVRTLSPAPLANTKISVASSESLPSPRGRPFACELKHKGTGVVFTGCGRARQTRH